MTRTNHVISDAVTAERITDEVAAGTTRASAAAAAYALGLGDDALILAQRLGEWIARGPELEEDIALGNVGLDLLGHARALLTYAGSAWGKSEDDLAYFRDEHEFRNRQLFELPRGDFGFTIARQLVASAYFYALYDELQRSTDATIAAIAAKAIKEVDYHLDHSVQWTRRLGLGTPESNRRLQAGIDELWPFVAELFATDAAADAAESGVAVSPAALRPRFDALVLPVLQSSDLTVPSVPAVRGGGRDGVHTEHLGHLLAELQVLARRHPGASW